MSAFEIAAIAATYLIVMTVALVGLCAIRAANRKHGLRLSDIPGYILLAAIWPALALYIIAFVVVWPAEKIEAWAKRRDRTLIRFRKPPPAGGEGG